MSRTQFVFGISPERPRATESTGLAPRSVPAELNPIDEGPGDLAQPAVASWDSFDSRSNAASADMPWRLMRMPFA